MPKALPQNPRDNAAWSPLQRRTWLAEQRRKHHLLPAPVLRAAYPTLLQWDWDLPNPYRWLVYWGHSTSGPWNFVSDYWHYGDSRQFAPDGGSMWHIIVGVDVSGNEITQRSNAVRPDDAPAPLVAATLARVGGYYQATAPVAASIWRFAQNDGYDGSIGTIQDWADSADISDAAYDLLPPNQAQSEQLFGNCSCRYQVAGVWSPWCAVI